MAEEYRLEAIIEASSRGEGFADSIADARLLSDELDRLDRNVQIDVRATVEREGVEQLQGELDALPNRVNTTVAARDTATSTFNEVRSEAAGIGALEPTIQISGQNRDWESAFYGTEAQIGRLNAARAEPTVGAKTEEGDAKIDAFGARLMRLQDLRVEATASVNTATGQQLLAALDANLKDFGRQIARAQGTVDTAEGVRRLADLRADLDQLKRETATARADVAVEEGRAKLTGLMGLLDRYGLLKPTATADLNTGQVEVKYSFLQGLMERYRLARPTATVDANTIPASKGFATATAEAAAVGRLHPTVTTDANTTPATRGFSIVTAAAAALGRLRPTATVDANTSPATRGFGAVTTQAMALGRLRPTLSVVADIGSAIRNFATVTAGAVAVGRLHPNIKVEADTTGATGHLTAFRALAGTVLSGVQGQAGGLASSFSGAGSLALVGAIALAVAALTGPLLSAATIAASAAGGLAAGVGLVAGAAYTLANSSSPAVVAAFQQLKGSFDQLKQDMFHAFEPAALELAGLGQTAISVADSKMPLLGSAAQSTVASINSAFQQAIDKVGPGASDSFSTILSYVPGLMGSMTTAATNFGGGFLSIMAQAMPQASSFMSAISTTAQSFFQWTQSSEDRAEIQRFLDAATPVAQQLWQAFTDIVPKLIDIGITYGPDVANAIGNISTGISDVLAVSDKLIGFFDDLAGGAEGDKTSLDHLGTSFSDLDTTITNMFEPFQQISDALNGINDAVGNAGKAVHDFFANTPGMLDPLAGPITDAIKKPFDDANNDVVGNGIVPEMVGSVVSYLSGLPGQAADVLSSLGDSINTQVENAKQWAVQTVLGLVQDAVSDIGELPDRAVSALNGLAPGLGDQFSNAATSALNALADLPGELYNVGVNLIQSIINGVSSAASGLYNTMSNLASNALQSAKNALGISSPSRPMTEYGENLGQSFANSIWRQVDLVRDASRELALAALPSDDLLARAAMPPMDLSHFRAPSTDTFERSLDGLIPGAPVQKTEELEPLGLPPGGPTLPQQSPGAPSGSTGGTAALEKRIASLEAALEKQTDTLVAVLAGGEVELSDGTAQNIGGHVKGAVKHNLANDRGTGTAAVAGITRYARRKEFEGSL